MRFLYTVLFIPYMCITLPAIEKTLTCLPERTSLLAKVNTAEIIKMDSINKVLSDGTNVKLGNLRQAIEAYAGLDILKVHTVWLATGQSSEFLAVIKGDFDSLPIEKALRRQSTYDAYKVDGVHFAGIFEAEKGSGKKNLFAVIDESTLLIGEEKFAKEYVQNYVGKGRALSSAMQQRIVVLEKSPVLLHAVTMNFILPEKDRENPLLKNFKRAELKLTLNLKDVGIDIGVAAYDTKHLVVVNNFLNNLLHAQRQKKTKADHILLVEALRNAKVSPNSQGISVETKLSRGDVEDVLSDQLFGLEKVFE
jgi:hypothetical protein